MYESKKEKGTTSSTLDSVKNQLQDSQIQNGIKTNLTEINKIEEIIDKITLTNKDIALQQLNKIISLLPTEISYLIENAFTYKRIPKEYLLSSILYAFSNAAGLAFSINCMNYTNYANLYFAIVGSRGDVKSAAMSLATQPLNKSDDQTYNEYQQKQQDAKNNNLSEDEKEKITRDQLLLQNATIEAAMQTHLNNEYSIGLYIDELKDLIEKMANPNNSNGNAWRTFLLQGSTNQHIDVSRKTTKSYRIKKSYPTLLGSIQHEFIPEMFANGNLESGFIDRLLFTTKLTSNDKLSRELLPYKSIENYNNSLINLLNYRKSIQANIITANKDSHRVSLDKSAEEKIFSYSQGLINKQKKRTDHTNEYIAKMLISIHKLTLLSHLLLNASRSTFQKKISSSTVDLAILFNDFYFTNFKIVLEHKKTPINKREFRNEVIKNAKQNNIAQKQVSELLGISKGYTSKLWEKN